MTRKPQTRATTVAHMLSPVTSTPPAAAVAPPAPDVQDRWDNILRTAWQNLRSNQRPYVTQRLYAAPDGIVFVLA